MSDSRPIVAANNNNEGCAIVDWTQVPNDEIRYDTDNEEEEEQVWLEAERAEREQIEAKRAERERVKAKACEEEERWEAKHKCKAEAGKGDEASAGGTSGEAGGEVKRVVMDPGCTHCAQAKVVCEFLVDSNKKWVACMHCNQSKGKCQWPRDGKDTQASPKATPKVDKGKKRKADDETPEPGPSQKKWVKLKLVEVLDIDKLEAGGSRARKAVAGEFLGLEDKLEQLIDIAGLIVNNLVGLFKVQEAAVENSGCIADALKAIINESYSFGVAVTPSDSGSSELHKEAEWLQAKGEEEEAKGEDEPMAE
ncbi:hypothetical protein M404DRAFT_35846 [Pisolithus tinctorius Marx 270]|uniref:Uncharacterized protein n=1 Tax=Pisolithus tinctorius Marx 270 TaxID=870435 RepID=A0A0C3MXR3_PISTI|nr:hypothetical protein M404DRAFT_36060 [Pisolithus tinctorius Marx 270]KIN93694.1 hypothetical protein M404DRAFT_35846 [Pisolithus tinctorius Marx 270]